MLLARVVKSNSHIDYLARILGPADIEAAPGISDFRFGQFVSISGSEGSNFAAVGVIYDSQLVNPEYGSLGPRLSTPQELNRVFSPDLLNEQGIVVAILLVGWLEDGVYRQGLPRLVLPINSDVIAMSDEEVRDFHHSPDGSIGLHYFPQLSSHSGGFSISLLDEIMRQLESLTDEMQKSRLAVLRRNLAWQQAMSNLK